VTVPNPPKYPALLAISPALPAILGISSNFEKVDFTILETKRKPATTNRGSSVFQKT
jgi:hypothetical protein